MDKVSDNYPKIEIAAIGALAGELFSFASVFDDGCFSLVELDNDTVGLCGGINTFARSKSALKHIEPVVIAISKNNWNDITPFVFSDRPDFPLKKFPHLPIPCANNTAGAHISNIFIVFTLYFLQYNFLKTEFHSTIYCNFFYITSTLLL